MDKFAIASTVQIASPASHPQKQSRLQRVPWLALASLFVVLICIASSVAVIVISNKQTVESWRVQPPVLLAILASVSSVALGAAFSVGVVVTWWTSAVEGASLSQLHYIWDRGGGLSFFSAFAAGATARKVVLTAFVISMVKFATNPLLQRSTRQRIEEIVTRETIQLNATQYLPDGWIGGKSGTSSWVRYRALGTVQAWWQNATIDTLNTPGYFCDGTCEGDVPGAGISYKCSSTKQKLNLFNATGRIVFAINTTFSQNSTGAPSLLLTTLHVSEVDNTCTATLAIDTCMIEAAVVEYPVVVQNSTITLNSAKLNNATVRSTHVYPGDLPTSVNGSLGTLQYLNDYFILLYFHTSNVASNPSTYMMASTGGTGGMMADMFFQSDPLQYDDYTSENCQLKWTSPTNHVLNSMQNFMFRAALRSARGTDIQTFTVRRTKLTLVFHSVYGYLAAASVITLLGMFSTLIMLPGWWVLGRTVSLSPLETARAFSAPVMESAGYNVSVDGIVQDIGQIRVKYVDGVMVRSD